MTPKEKAIVLCKKYYRDSDLLAEDLSWIQAKECALITADEVINTLNYDIRDLDVRGSLLLDIIDYWRKVKQEIQKL